MTYNILKHRVEMDARFMKMNTESRTRGHTMKLKISRSKIEIRRNFLLAQHLRDASMSHYVAESYYRLGKKILHINGRFHSDENLGVAYRLKSSGLKVLTVSMFPNRESKQISEFTNLADIIYLTGK